MKISRAPKKLQTILSEGISVKHKEKIHAIGRTY